MPFSWSIQRGGGGSNGANRRRLLGNGRPKGRCLWGGPRDALEGKGPQRRFGRRLEEVAKAVGGGYCRLHMPLRRALGVSSGVDSPHTVSRGTEPQDTGHCCPPPPPRPQKTLLSGQERNTSKGPGIGHRV